MKKLLLSIPFVLTAACMGGETFEYALTTQDSNFTNATLIGRSFGDDGVSISSSATQTLDASLQINSASSAVLTIDGDSYTLFAGGDTTFESVTLRESATLATRLTGGPETRDVLYIFGIDRPGPFLAGERVTIFVDGNETAASRLPGTASYSGTAVGMNASGATANGTIALGVDFAGNSFDATLNGVNPSSRLTSYSVIGGTENAGGLIGTITGGGALAGVLEGHIYGPGADQAAGTFLISLPTGSVIGAFGAVD